MHHLRLLTRSPGVSWVKVEKLWPKGNNVLERTLYKSTCYGQTLC